MTVESPDEFCKSYAAYKRYQTPVVKAKHVRWYDREFWAPAGCTPETSVLEIGSGTGEFLAYLKRKGVKRFEGVERDRDAVAVMEPALKDRVHVGDAWQFLARGDGVRPFDRVVMLDVLEHFSAVDGVRLLEKIKGVLASDGLVVVRVPNMSSPWGGIYQFSDLTHKTAYTPGSLEQLALAAGYEAAAFLPQRRGSPFRRFAEDCLHWLLARMLATAPTVWTANVIAVLRPAAKK
ncbi:MAG: class I SAM-dependent methyltransferase [Rhodospirillales bacterium]|nr:class I SAM-dependent methyltransferase [Rhodospirillales bacterium]